MLLSLAATVNLQIQKTICELIGSPCPPPGPAPPLPDVDPTYAQHHHVVEHAHAYPDTDHADELPVDIDGLDGTVVDTVLSGRRLFG